MGGSCRPEIEAPSNRGVLCRTYHGQITEQRWHFERTDCQLRVTQVATGEDSVAIWANAGGGPAALRFALQSPDKVSRLVLVDTCANISDVWEPDAIRVFVDLARTDWALLAQTFGDMSTRQEVPEAGLRWREAYFRSTTGEEMARASSTISADEDRLTADALRSIQTPALVLHRRNDLVMAFDLGRTMAAALPNATFVPLDGVITAAALGDSESILRAVLPFLGEGAEATARAEPLAKEDIHTILFTDVEISTALTQRLGDAKARPAAGARANGEGGAEVPRRLGGEDDGGRIHGLVLLCH